MDAQPSDASASLRLSSLARAVLPSRLSARLLATGTDGLRSNNSIVASTIEERPSQECDTHSLASTTHSIAESRAGATTAPPPSPATA